MMAKMDKPLAEVFSPVKFGDCAWAALDPVNDVFAITQSALTDPSGQSRDGLFIAMLIIEYEKTGHSRPLDEQVPLDPRSGRRWIPTRYRSGTADHDTRSDGKLRQHSIANRPSSVVEIYVDTTRTRSDERITKCASLIVNHFVVPEFFAA
jgi:hypothetical protein